MTSTRSSALRCPSWRRKTLTIRSRLLDRFSPAGRTRSRSEDEIGMRGSGDSRRGKGRGVAPCPSCSVAVPGLVHTGRLTLFRIDRTAAAARRRGVGVLDGEAAAGDGLDEVDLRTLEVPDADR